MDIILFEISVISSADTGCYHMHFLLKPHWQLWKVKLLMQK